MTKTLNVGYIQFEPQFGKREENINHILELITQAKKPDLIVLPELCTTGYAFESYDEAKSFSENIPQGVTTKSLEQAAKRHQVHIVAGLNEIDQGTLYNSAVFITPKGYRGKYRKNHLFNKEKLIFTPGNLNFPIFQIGEIKIGILICFDWIFPETWRTLALKGADIVCHPSNLVLEKLATRAIPITAMINKIYIICANRIGKEKNLKFIGSSMIVNPKGDAIHSAPNTEEEVYVTTINPYDARNKMVTERNDVLGDRRPDIYEI